MNFFTVSFILFLNIFSTNACHLVAIPMARKMSTELHECGCSKTLPFISRAEVVARWNDTAELLEDTIFYPMNFQIIDCKEFRISCADPTDHYFHFNTVENYGAMIPFLVQYNYTAFPAVCDQTTHHWSEANIKNVDIETSYAYACVKAF